MKKRDYSKLLAELAEEHAKRSPRPSALNETAKQYIVDINRFLTALFSIDNR